MVAAAMQVRARLSVDATRAALNTAAHASEHCAVDRESLRALGSEVGRQVLVRRSSKLFALYSVAERARVPGPAVHVGPEGIARLHKPTGEPPPRNDPSKFAPPWWWRSSFPGLPVFPELAPLA
jgi:hypothetical protein